MTTPWAVGKGVIRGKTIELDAETGLPDGLAVRVSIVADSQAGMTDEEKLEAFKRAAGGWSDDPEGLERYLEWNRQQRKGNPTEFPG